MPVEKPLELAFASSNYLYIYPVFNDVLYLKKDTAIVSKNRVQNPFHKIHQAEIDQFNSTYGLSDERTVDSTLVDALDKTLRDQITDKLSKSGDVFITANAHTVDDIHNITYGFSYDTFLYFDHQLERLQKIKTELPNETVKVFIDKATVPVESNCVQAFVDFEKADFLEKDEQVTLYNELKRVLAIDGASVKLYRDQKNLTLKKLLKADLRAVKAKNMLTPWKKQKLPFMYFLETDQPSTPSDSQQTVKKAKFSPRLG